MELGEFIHTRREELGISRREAANLLGISLDYYKKIELGLRKPSVNLKAKIAAILKIPLGHLT